MLQSQYIGHGCTEWMDRGCHKVISSGGKTVMILESNSGLNFLLSTETFSDVRTYGI